MALYVKSEVPGAALAGSMFYDEPANVALASTAQEDMIATTEAQRKSMNRMLLIGGGLAAVALLVWLGAFKSVVQAVKR